MIFRKNVFARAEWAHLQRTVGNFQHGKLGLLLIACNLLFASLPFLAVEHYADIPFHIIIGLCLILFCLGYEIRLITLAIGAIDHEKQNRTWDNLVLTGVSARQVVFGKWLAVMRYSLGLALLLTISKLAIAYSVMQYLNIFPLWIDPVINDWNRAFVYMSSLIYPYGPIAYYPQVWQVITAFTVLGVISIAEIGMLTGLGILCGFIKTRFTAVKFGGVLAIRALVSIVGVLLIGFVGQLEMQFHKLHTLPRSDNFTLLWNCDGEFFWQKTDYYAWCVVERDNRRMFEMAQVTTSAMADNGVLLAANIMRPIGTLPFALRNVFSAVIILIIMVEIAFFSLFVASRLVPKSTK